MFRAEGFYDFGVSGYRFLGCFRIVRGLGSRFQGFRNFRV